MRTLLLLAACLLPCAVATAQDRAWYDTLPATQRTPIEWTRRSIHIPMRDGVRIAADVYLPAGAGSIPPLQVPTILHQTRYRRGVQFRDSSLEANAGPPYGLMAYLQAGYAVTITDVRGTGASFGTRTTEFSPDEVRDGWDVLDWIVAQPWSDGSVGAVGVSYPGITAELVGTLGHPALKAVAPQFSVYDLYADVIRPGGIFLERFFQDWDRLVRGMDANRFDPPNGPITGVRPVDGPDGPRLLAEAIAEHAGNASIYTQARAMETRDDRDATGLSLNDISPHARYDTLSRRIPIYNYGGWPDGFAGAPIKRFLAQPSPGSRLIMGPWNHGGAWAYYPSRGAVRSQFDHQRELLRFFDHHLRGTSTGIEHEPPVWYFTTGENRWKSAAAWPVDTRDTTLHLQSDGRLTAQHDDPPEPRHAPLFAAFDLDSILGTGNQSRWNTILGGGAVRYRPRPAPTSWPHARGWIAFESATLQSAATITGHPVLHLVTKVCCGSPTVFVYLEDVDSNGVGTMITEGQLNLAHRQTGSAPAWYPRPEAYRAYRRADMKPITSLELIETPVELLPVSHRVDAGHRIRVVIASADADHFALPGDRANFALGSFGSRIVLPVER